MPWLVSANRWATSVNSGGAPGGITTAIPSSRRPHTRVLQHSNQAIELLEGSLQDAGATYIA